MSLRAPSTQRCIHRDASGTDSPSDTFGYANLVCSLLGERPEPEEAYVTFLVMLSSSVALNDK